VTKVNAGGNGPIGYFAVSAPDMTMEQLSWFIDDTISRRLLSIEGMATVSRAGGVDREIRVVLDPAIHPGGFASAVINGGAVVAPRLPESAIMSDTRGSYVFVVGKDNKVERRDVKTGTVTDEGTAVISGLNGNERVVLRAGGFLNPGDKVRPVLSTR
jgi:multidrug efflux pump subunit AcrA (membrane-fusion protein)